MNKKNIENYICLCSKVSKSAFNYYLSKNPNVSLEKIFYDLNIGNQCAACRLDIEQLYLYSESSNVKIKKNTKPLLNNLVSSLKKNFLFKNFYVKKKILNQVAPILSGPNIYTDLIVSNHSIGNFKKYVVPFKVEVIIRDNNGKVIENTTYTILPETRLVKNLNKKLINNKLQISAAGSVWVKLYSNYKGFIGVTRPHIRITTKNSISSIHMQHGRRKPGYYFTNINSNENHFLSIVNQDKLVNKFPIILKNNSNKTFKKFFTVLPFSAILINLSEIKELSKIKEKDSLFFFNHKGILRRNIIIQYKDNLVTSIDHI